MTYTKGDCRNALESWYNKHGKAPTSDQWRENNMSPSCRTVGRKFGSWSNAIFECGMEPNRDRVGKDVNEGYFSKVDNSETAYWLGMMYADGSMIDRGNGYTLSFGLIDRDVIEQFKEDIESEHKILVKESFENHQEFYRIEIGSQEFCENLLKWGVTSTKTYSPRAPILNDKHKPAFVRGYTDGDGCFSNSNNIAKWNISASHKGLISTILKWVPTTSYIYEQEEKGMFHGSVHSSYVNELGQWLYPDGSNTYPKMERKYNSYTEAVS